MAAAACHSPFIVGVKRARQLADPTGSSLFGCVGLKPKCSDVDCHSVGVSKVKLQLCLCRVKGIVNLWDTLNDKLYGTIASGYFSILKRQDEFGLCIYIWQELPLGWLLLAYRLAG